MKVLSLFDGISCARLALERAKIPVTEYSACEIDKFAIKVSQSNWPTIKHLGSVKDVSGFQVDMLIGGSPCQDLSVAKKDRKGLQGDRSSLFWEYVRLLNECKPTWFIFENVASMKKEDMDTISKALQVEPILINASLVSAQSRKRLFWTNIPNVKQPADRGILLKDILQDKVDERFYVKNKTYTIVDRKSDDFKQLGYVGAENASKVGGQALRIYDPEYKSVTVGTTGVGLVSEATCVDKDMVTADGKAFCLTATYSKGHSEEHIKKYKTRTHVVKKTYMVSMIGRKMKDGVRCDDDPDAEYEQKVSLKLNQDKTGVLTGVQKDNLLLCENKIRKLTPIECERLQGVPDDYTAYISNTQRYKCLGNAFNVDVIAHILSHIPPTPCC